MHVCLQAVALELKRLYRCCPVYMDLDVKDKFYKGFCKQQLWPLFHYILPQSPGSTGRFDAELWQAYVKANKVPLATCFCMRCCVLCAHCTLGSQSSQFRSAASSSMACWHQLLALHEQWPHWPSVYPAGPVRVLAVDVLL